MGSATRHAPRAACNAAWTPAPSVQEKIIQNVAVEYHLRHLERFAQYSEPFVIEALKIENVFGSEVGGTIGYTSPHEYHLSKQSL